MIKLPIVVSEEELQENPKFSKLLYSLSEKCLCEDGLNQSLSRQLEQTQRQLSHTKQTYFHNVIVLDTIREMISQQHLLHDSNLKNILGKMDKLIRVAECQQVMQDMTVMLRKKEDCLLGVDQLWLDEVHGVRHLMENLDSEATQFILPDLEERLQSKLETVTHFSEPLLNNLADEICASNESNVRKAPDFTLNLHANNTYIQTSITSALRRGKQDLAIHRKHLRKQILKLQQDSWIYYKKIWQCLVIMTDMIQKFRMDYFPSFDKLTIDWLCQRVDTLYKKVLVLKYQYLSATYNAESVPSLRQMRDSLDSEYDKCRKQHQVIEYELAEYAKVGEGFDQLVEEYTLMLKRIEEKEWQLKQLYQHKHQQRLQQEIQQIQLSQHAQQLHQQQQQQQQHEAINSHHHHQKQHSYASTYDQQLRELFADDDDDDDDQV